MKLTSSDMKRRDVGKLALSAIRKDEEGAKAKHAAGDATTRASKYLEICIIDENWNAMKNITPWCCYCYKYCCRVESVGVVVFTNAEC